MDNFKLNKGLLRPSSARPQPSNSISTSSTNNENGLSPSLKGDHPLPRSNPHSERKKSMSLKLTNKTMLASVIPPSSRHNLPLTSKKATLSSSIPAAQIADSSHSISYSELSNQSDKESPNYPLSDFTSSLTSELLEVHKIPCQIPDSIMAQKEQEIIKQVAEISQSIEDLLKQRKELQMNHKNWLCDRKKKINQVRKETSLMQNPNQAQSNNLFLLQVLNI